MEAQMLSLLVLCSAALGGYSFASTLLWPAAALSLVTISWAENYLIARRAGELGFGAEITDTLLRSSANALIATGACYWSGVLLRTLSGL